MAKRIEVEPFPGREQPTKPQPEQTGAVLVFKPGVTVEQAREALAPLADKLEGTPNIQTFFPEWGGPVFYIP